MLNDNHQQLHCSMDHRSFTDPVTNSVLLGPIDLKKHFSSLVKLQFPEMALPSFLHESTHHWCFHSPVGTTIALLKMRAQRRIIEDDLSVDDRFDILEDLIRYEAVLEWMRPLAEGLALFAEYDSTPGPSEVISNPMTWASLLFTEKSTNPKDFVQEREKKLFSLLLRYRMSEQTLQKKIGLLTAPLAISTGGYLIGYLLVKSIWGIALSRCSRFSDTDLFLTYLRSFFYDDMAFVHTILDPDTLEIQTYNSITSYFQSRFQTLVESDLEANVPNFERFVSNRYPAHIGANEIASDPSKFSKGKESLNKLFKEVTVDAPSHAILSAQRELLCVGSAGVRVTVDGNRVSVKERELGLFGPTIQDVQKGSGDGSIEVYLAPSTRYIAIAVTRGTELVSYRFLTEVSKEIEEWFRLFILNKSKVDSINKEFNQRLEEFVQDTKIGVILRYLRSSNSLIQQAYQRRSLLHVPESKLNSVCGSMRQTGFLNLLDQNRDLLEGLALISLGSSLAFSKDTFSHMFKKRGIDFDRCISDLELKSGQYKIPFMLDIDKRLLCFV